VSTYPSGGPAGEVRGGSIYDLGYRGYEGRRLGRRGALTALVAHSLRTAYGLGRSARSKVVPVGITVLAVLPSTLALGVLMLVNAVGAPGEAFEAISPIRYATLFPMIASLVFLFCAAQAPELFGRDQQTGVLPLYFSRAIGPLDYALARVLGLYLSLAVLVAAPYLLLLIGRVLVAADLFVGLQEELPSLLPAAAMGLLVVLTVGSISAAVASLTPRRAYSTAAIIGVFLITNVGATMLVSFDTGVFGQVAALLSPSDVLDGANSYLFDIRPTNVIVANAGNERFTYVLTTAVWIGGALAVLLYRYRTLRV